MMHGRNNIKKLYYFFSFGARLGQRHALAALPPGKRAGTHCIGGWVGHIAGLGGCGISLPTTGFERLTVQLVASCCTD
jgi:hypothetical protein